MIMQKYNQNIKIKPIIVQTHQSGQRLDKVLVSELSCFSRSQIKCWILNKKVIVNNQISILPKKKMIVGELIEIKNIDESNILCSNIVIPQNISLNIIYEDNDILVINKPSNMVVYPGHGHYTNTVLHALLYKYPNSINISQHAGIVHRLDKDTTGLMIIAKNNLAYDKLRQLFQKRQVIKKYDAIVFGKFSNITGTVNEPIKRHSTRRTCMTVNALGKQAVTHYSVIEEFDIHSRIYIHIKTGRTHQIRVHMSYINHPLVGDQKYGKVLYNTIKISDKLNNYLHCFNRQALHACELQLLHPITQVQMQWYAPLPSDIVDLIHMLRKN